MKRIKTLTKKSNGLFGLLLAIILFIGLGIFLLPDQVTQYPQYIVESPSPTGTKAFYTLLNKNYDQVAVWEKSENSLSGLDSNQLMIMIEPNKTFDSNESAVWLEWIEQGNTLMLIKKDPENYFDLETSITDNQLTAQASDIVYSPSKVDYKGNINTNHRLVPKIEDQILLNDNLGVIALSRTYGNGKLIVSLNPDWLMNESILKYNHLEMTLMLIGQADLDMIWFNDYIHDYNYNYFAELYPEWLLLLVAQGTIILFFWLWYKGKRFGPIEIPREWVVRYGDERIHALASWYLDNAFYKQSLLDQEEYLRYTIRDKWGIPVSMEISAWIEAIKYYLPQDKYDYWSINFDGLKKIIDKEKVSYKDYHKWSKFLNNLRNEVENYERKY